MAKTIASRYRLRRSGAREGAVRWYAAEDVTDSRPVIVALISDAHVENRREALSLERLGRTWRLIEAPGLAPLLEVGRDDCIAYLVGSLPSGQPIAELLAGQGPIPPGRAIEIVQRLGQALEPVHANGLVHGRLTPAAVWIEPNGGVRLLSAPLSGFRPGSSNGRSGGKGQAWATYRAPEQLRGLRPTPAADVYALGSLLYHMLSGRLPYEVNDQLDLTRRQIHTAPAALPSTLPAVGPGLGQLVERCLARDPELRPPDARALLRDIQRYRALSEARTERLTGWRPPKPQPAATRPTRRGPASHWPRAILLAVLAVAGLAACVTLGGLLLR